MNLERVIRSAVFKKENGGKERWPQYFWAIDLHGTIIKPTYDKNDCSCDFYPNAKKVLKRLSERKDMMLILWTGTHETQLRHYLTKLKENKIIFDAINKNPKCENDELRDTSEKLYFDILLDDKAGFHADIDWYNLEYMLKYYKLWEKGEE